MGSCSNKLEINASIGKVWETIFDFHYLSWAPRVVTSIESIGDKSVN